MAVFLPLFCHEWQAMGPKQVSLIFSARNDLVKVHVSNWRSYLGPSNMVEWGIPEKIMQNSVQMS